MVSPVHAQDGEYALGNPNWNGLSRFAELAQGAGIEVIAPPQQLDMSQLKPSDGLLVVFPGSALPRADLGAFMAAGGRLAIADDFGAGSELLTGFGIGRQAPGAVPRERRLRGNVNVLIAKPEARHPLSEGVPVLVTNHPQVLRHESLEAIFSVAAQSAVVLSGGVGKGRLVALGDPSALINNMLEFRGNETFARNLIGYLAQHGRLWIVSPTTRIAGHYGQSVNADPLAVLRTALERIAHVRLPPVAVRLTTGVMVAVLLFGAATALPRRATYARAVSLPALETVAGFAGRVRFFERKQRDLTAPLLVYKIEFERRLQQDLALEGQAALHELEAALSKAGVASDTIATTRSLLIEFEQIALERERPGSATPLVQARKFHAMLATGDRILGALSEQRTRRAGSRS